MVIAAFSKSRMFGEKEAGTDHPYRVAGNSCCPFPSLVHLEAGDSWVLVESTSVEMAAIVSRLAIICVTTALLVGCTNGGGGGTKAGGSKSGGGKAKKRGDDDGNTGVVRRASIDRTQRKPWHARKTATGPAHHKSLHASSNTRGSPRPGRRGR
jgi:hypothetical protein